MRKILASVTLAASLAIPTTLVAAPAIAAPDNTNYTTVTRTNWDQFKTGAGSYFSITVKAASSKGGKGIAGKAQLKLDGVHQRWRVLDKGSITFHIYRSELRNRAWVEVAVRTWPKGDGRPSVVAKFKVRDIPRSKSGGASKVVRVARAQVGDRYVFGKAGPSSFDCSGLSRYAWKHGAGKSIPHSSSAQSHVGKRVSSPKPGDLVVSPGHVAIYAGGGKVIEAATPATGVVERKMWQRSPEFRRP